MEFFCWIKVVIEKDVILKDFCDGNKKKKKLLNQHLSEIIHEYLKIKRQKY